MSPKKPYRLLWILLLVSLILRWILVFQGGQYFFPDEDRYFASRKIVNAVFSGEIGLAAGLLLTSAKHPGFRWFGLPPAILEWIVGEHLFIPALYFSLFSVLNIWLVWKIALTVGADEDEAFMASFLFACSASLLYHVRHLFPYDAALSMGLGTLLFAMRTGRREKSYSVVCGVMASCCFLTYSGFWTLAGFGLVVYVLKTRYPIKVMLLRALFSLIGLFTPLVLLVVGSAVLKVNLFDRFLDFSSTITQGSFQEGWSLPFEYLWHTDHVLLVVWGIAWISCFIQYLQGNLEKRGKIWLAGWSFIYGCFVIFSIGLEKFVVYGRLVKQLVPFFCLLGAYGLSKRESLIFSKPWRKRVTCGLLIIHTGINFYQPLIQIFPREFMAAHIKSIPDEKPDNYAFIYTHCIYTSHIDPEFPPIPVNSYKVIASARHPQQYLPYQYEEFTPEQRIVLRSTDFSMRLIYVELK